jgi:hypothetical protein
MGDDSCTACPAGKYTQVYNARVCISCEKGQFADPAEYANIAVMNVGNFRGCEHCPAGKWQDELSSTDCEDCRAGHWDDRVADPVAGAKSHDEQCKHCPNGRFQHQAGSLTCYDCPSGKFTSTHDITGVEYEHSTCESCTVYSQTDDTADFTLRHYWTQNEAGWDKCEKKAVDCKPNPWQDDWTPCSRSCKNTISGEVGDEDRYIKPVYHAWGEMAHADAQLRPKLCSATLVRGDPASQDYVQWVTGATRADDQWHEKITGCNQHFCPVDCIVSPWSLYDQCTKTCGAGETTRTRSITRSPMYGGKACPARNSTIPCNAHACKHAICHNSHVHCHIRFVSYGRPTTCTTNDIRCHECDDALECQAKHLVRTVSVTHDRKFQYIAGDFKCRVQDSTGEVSDEGHGGVRLASIPDARRSCVCRCSKHPMSCFYKNKVVQSAYLAGSILQNVESMEMCSNLCSHHPECAAWEYDSRKKCVLKSGASSGGVTFMPNTQVSVTTWAGAQSGTTGCVQQQKIVVCPLGKYRAEGDGTVAYQCTACPTGFTSHMINAKGCAIKYGSGSSSDHDCGPGMFVAPVPNVGYWDGEPHAHAHHTLTTSAPLSESTDHGVLCLACPAGKFSATPGDGSCDSVDTEGVHNVGVATGVYLTPSPTALPTFAPTKMPSALDCTAECATDLTHSSLQAKCLACKGGITIEKFCEVYPIISGC